jgi:hypothetical protein
MEAPARTNASQAIPRNAIGFPTFLAFILSLPIFGVVMAVGEGTSEVLGYMIWGVGNFVLCFFIVRKYPKSALLAWFPPNLMIVLAAFAEPGFWRTDMWKVEAGVVLLSMLGAGIGVVFKKKVDASASDSTVPSNK